MTLKWLLDLPHLAFTVSIVIALAGLIVSPKGPFKDFFKKGDKVFGPGSLWVTFFAFITYFGIMAVHLSISDRFLTSWPTDQGLRHEFKDLPLSVGLTIALLNVVIVPFFEETLFRGYGLELFKRIGLPRTGIVMTSLLFGFSHSPHWAGTAFIGVLFCYLRIYNRTLLASIAAHTSINAFVTAFALAFNYFGNDGGSSDMDSNDFPLGIAVGIIFILVGLNSNMKIIRYLRAFSKAAVLGGVSKPQL